MSNHLLAMPTLIFSLLDIRMAITWMFTITYLRSDIMMVNYKDIFNQKMLFDFLMDFSTIICMYRLLLEV